MGPPLPRLKSHDDDSFSSTQSGRAFQSFTNAHSRALMRSTAAARPAAAVPLSAPSSSHEPLRPFFPIISANAGVFTMPPSSVTVTTD